MIRTGNLTVFFFLSLFFTIQAHAAKLNTELSEKYVSVGDVFSIILSVETTGQSKPKVEVKSKDRPRHEAMSYLRELVFCKVIYHNTTKKPSL